MQNNFGFCNRFVLLLYRFSQVDLDAHAFNAPPSRCIMWYRCTNPHCGKVSTSVFAYDQHRNHATRAGTLCASIMMREELTGVRRADRSTAVLSARPRPGFDGEQETRTERHAHRAMSMSLCLHEMPPSSVGNLDEFRISSKFVKIQLNIPNFFQLPSTLI